MIAGRCVAITRVCGFRIACHGGAHGWRRPPSAAATVLYFQSGARVNFQHVPVIHVPLSEPSKIVIKSINPQYETYERDAEEVNIIGRVIWAAKRL